MRVDIAERLSWGRSERNGALHARTDQWRLSRRQINERTSKGIGSWEGQDQRVLPVCTMPSPLCTAWAGSQISGPLHRMGAWMMLEYNAQKLTHTQTHTVRLSFTSAFSGFSTTERLKMNLPRRHYRPVAAADGSLWLRPAGFVRLSFESVSQVLGSKSTLIWAASLCHRLVQQFSCVWEYCEVPDYIACGWSEYSALHTF